MTSELSEFTSGQLLKELLSRPTFAGFVVFSQEEVKQIKAHRHWYLAQSQTLTLEHVQIILKELIDKLEVAS